MSSIAVDEVLVDEPPPKWALIVSGVAWLLVSLIVLSGDLDSAVTIGFMMGVVLILGGVDEFAIMVVAPGWKWAHGLLGGLFVLTGVACLLEPFQTFGILAMFAGWYLLFKGSFDIALSIGARRALPLWGLMLAVGIGEIFLGLWALGYPGRSAWLLVFWVGAGALFRGIGNLVLAFTHGGHS